MATKRLKCIDQTIIVTGGGHKTAHQHLDGNLSQSAADAIPIQTQNAKIQLKSLSPPVWVYNHLQNCTAIYLAERQLTGYRRQKQLMGSVVKTTNNCCQIAFVNLHGGHPGN